MVYGRKDLWVTELLRLRLNRLSTSLDIEAPQRGLQIAKAKLSVRKTEERICKEGEEGGKEAAQASA
jgi:hypothetical protein